MFNPSQADVRRFLCAVHAKTLSGAPMEAIETLATTGGLQCVEIGRAHV